MAKTETKETGIDLVITTELKKFNVTDSFFKKMATKFNKLKIDDVNDKEGYDKVKEALALTRSTKSTIELKRKELKADSLKFGRAIDFEAKRIQEMLLPINEKLQQKRNVFDAEKDKIKKEKADARERVIQARSVLLMEIGMTFSGLSYEVDGLAITNAELTVFNDKNFDAFIEEAKEKIAVIKSEETRNKLLAKLLQERTEKINKYAKFIDENENDLDYAIWNTDEFNEYLAELISRSIEHERKIKEEQEKAAIIEELTTERSKEIVPLMRFSAKLIRLTELGLMDSDEFYKMLAELQEAKDTEKKKDEENKRLMELHEARMSEIAPLLRYQTEYINTEDIADWSEDDFNITISNLKQGKVDFEAGEKKAAQDKKDLAERQAEFDKKAEESKKAEVILAEKRRQAELKPDKVKLKAFAKMLTEIEPPKVKTKEAGTILLDAILKITEIANEINSKIGNVNDINVSAKHIKSTK